MDHLVSHPIEGEAYIYTAGVTMCDGLQPGDNECKVLHCHEPLASGDRKRLGLCEGHCLPTTRLWKWAGEGAAARGRGRGGAPPAPPAGRWVLHFPCQHHRHLATEDQFEDAPDGVRRKSCAKCLRDHASRRCELRRRRGGGAGAASPAGGGRGRGAASPARRPGRAAGVDGGGGGGAPGAVAAAAAADPAPVVAPHPPVAQPPPPPPPPTDPHQQHWLAYAEAIAGADTDGHARFQGPAVEHATSTDGETEEEEEEETSGEMEDDGDGGGTSDETDMEDDDEGEGGGGGDVGMGGGPSSNAPPPRSAGRKRGRPAEDGCGGGGGRDNATQHAARGGPAAGAPPPSRRHCLGLPSIRAAAHKAVAAAADAMGAHAAAAAARTEAAGLTRALHRSSGGGGAGAGSALSLPDLVRPDPYLAGLAAGGADALLSSFGQPQPLSPYGGGAAHSPSCGCCEGEAGPYFFHPPGVAAGIAAVNKAGREAAERAAALAAAAERAATAQAVVDRTAAAARSGAGAGRGKGPCVVVVQTQGDDLRRCASSPKSGQSGEAAALDAALAGEQLPAAETPTAAMIRSFLVDVDDDGVPAAAVPVAPPAPPAPPAAVSCRRPTIKVLFSGRLLGGLPAPPVVAVAANATAAAASPMVAET